MTPLSWVLLENPPIALLMLVTCRNFNPLLLLWLHFNCYLELSSLLRNITAWNQYKIQDCTATRHKEICSPLLHRKRMKREVVEWGGCVPAKTTLHLERILFLNNLIIKKLASLSGSWHFFEPVFRGYCYSLQILIKLNKALAYIKSAL
jgi:hypothetical protein